MEFPNGIEMGPVNRFGSPLNSQHQQTLRDLHEDLKQKTATSFGYPCSQGFNYEALLPFMGFSLNNVGDPFRGSNYAVNSLLLEQEVVHFFADLYKAPKYDRWGYVTSGGTEGNILGMYLASQYYPTGVAYLTDACHYSAVKLVKLLKLDSVILKSKHGIMDYGHLRKTLSDHPKEKPIIFFVNIGNTMYGAIDDIDEIKRALKEYDISDYYIHCDAALSGSILPFMDEPQRFHLEDGVDSLAVSGHKFIGSPMPCGIFMTRASTANRIGSVEEVIGGFDNTLLGSRNAFTPLALWYAIKSLGTDGMKAMADHCIEMADYAIEALQRIDVESWRHKNSLTVIFPRPSGAFAKRWQLASVGDLSHIITLPNVTPEFIDQFVAELREDMDPQQVA